ncbi:phosphoglucomutase, partial [Quercus suber]
DFGIKYNMENGGPAPEGITDKIYENTKTIKEYFIAEDLPDVDISAEGVTSFAGPEGQFDVEVFDSASDYVKLMKGLIYAVTFIVNFSGNEDFGGGHPDPNLTYAKELVARMGLGKSSSQGEPPEFGAAADGDADRNMILGKRFFVTPSDSVAIIAANAVESIPYFSAGLKGVARFHIFLFNFYCFSVIVKGTRSDVSKVVNADEFEYKDPVDGSISKHQGIRYLFEDGSRLVFRLSGTGSEGATIRLYIEQYEKDPSKTGRDSQDALAPLVEVALKLSKMQEFTGRTAPTVIT